jgi:hypothetical protein
MTYRINSVDPRTFLYLMRGIDQWFWVSTGYEFLIDE